MMKKKHGNFYEYYLGNRLRDLVKIYVEFGLTCLEANSTANLVSFGSDITELWMHENSDFVVPVNIFTPFACTPFSAGHTTMRLDNDQK